MPPVDSIVAEIAREHVAHVPFPLSHAELSDAAEKYMAFLDLPDEVKQSFSVKGGFEHNYGVLGYKDRRNELGMDKKEFFHYHPGIEEYFSDNPHRTKPAVHSFIEAARALDAAAASTLRTLLGVLSQKYPRAQDEYFSGNNRRTLLRFLKYDVAGKGNFLAKAHYDSGGCTLALAESAPGLRVGTVSEDLKPVSHTDHTALFMPGLYFHEVTDTTFHPVWHDVIQTEENTHSETTARWAIVFFADGESQKERPSREEVYTPRKFF